MHNALIKFAALNPGAVPNAHQAAGPELLQRTDGVLKYWGLGTGKTFGSIVAAESVADDEKKKVKVLVPAALRNNYRKEVDRFTTAPQKYDIGSYDSAAKSEVVPSEVAVLDEVHRLRNQGSQYDAAMSHAGSSKKRILLTATPIVNSPGDLASIVNLLHGKQLYRPDTFEDRFVSDGEPDSGILGILKLAPKPGTIQNRDELKALLKGRVSYVGDIGSSKPEVNESTVDVPMTSSQDRLYKTILNDSPPWVRWMVRNNLPPSKAQAGQLNSFLSGIRQVSLSPQGFDKRLNHLSAFKQSGKLQRAFADLKTELDDPEKKVMVYSNFVESGLKPYAAALEQQGIPHALFTGGMSDKARKESLDAYNQGKLRVVLVGPAGAEGISLKGTRLLQVLDPHWHESRTSQAVGRGVRLDSHTHLPEVDRNVSVIKYVSRPQQGLIRRLLGLKNKTVGADTFLSTRAAEKQEQLDVFNDLLKEVGQNR